MDANQMRNGMSVKAAALSQYTVQRTYSSEWAKAQAQPTTE